MFFSSLAKFAFLTWLLACAEVIFARPSSAKVPKTYGVLLYDSFTSLDVMGPLALLTRVPGVEIHFIYQDISPVPSGNSSSCYSSRFAGEFFIPTHTMETAPALDVLIVPGGLGTLRLTGPTWADFVSKVYPNLDYLFSVCTGAGIVAQTGLLDGRRATSNKAAFEWVVAQGPKVDWVAEARWVVDGNIWTSSGVEAGTDMAYAFISEVYGQHTAQTITNFLEYTPITNSSYDPFAAVYNLTDSNFASLASINPTVSQWGILAYPGFVGLDAISVTTYIEFVALQAAFPGNISIIAHDLKDVETSGPIYGGHTLVPTHTFASPPLHLDVLVVPGLPTTGPFPYHAELIRFIKKTYPSLKHIISVGTGSMLLAASGVLHGRQATTSKALFHPATAPYRSRHDDIKWTTGRWVRDGNVWTASGTASGLDAANALSISMFGEAATLQATTMMEYIPNTNSTYDPFAKVWGV